MDNEITFAIFLGPSLVATGSIDVAVQSVLDQGVPQPERCVMLEEQTGRSVDIDWRGTPDEIVEHAIAQFATKPPGRPKLGVEGREVTLLPRHWRWLSQQRGGASAALRRLVEADMRGGKADPAKIDALYRQMSVLAGDHPGFEEAARQLYAGNREGVDTIIGVWPGDLPTYFGRRLDAVFAKQAA